MTATTPTAPLTLQKVPLSSEAARIGATAWQAVCGGARFAARAFGSDDLAATGAGETRNTFAALGPTYVKLGQLIASSPGVFPRVLSDEFRTLLDRVPPAELVGEQSADLVGIRTRCSPSSIPNRSRRHPSPRCTMRCWCPGSTWW